MIGPSALDHDLGPLLRAWPLGIGSDIAYGLLDKRPIARRSSSAKFLFAPSQNFTDILASGGGKTRLMPHTFCQSCESRRNCGEDPLVRAGRPRPPLFPLKQQK